ncbi:pyruvate dehydrogenase (acetyl-transferring) E1 component subunit alpha [Streptomyces sp. NBC_01497]|uniref:pyruvate dehydrogenase (acetyl-transferring) E1 component subunit alpha n=1 Tax=Streptomyces sp. NBC_01497 TaxID=2903885 RepID=UPI002E311603|nr:pyruvate dehydrogenase (acetyl-transferring) E1 component subunit alpha [Streptomyces sp. NBC_01497]
MTVESTTARKPRSGEAAQDAGAGRKTTRAAAATPAGTAKTAKTARSAKTAKSAGTSRANGTPGTAAGGRTPAGSRSRGTSGTAGTDAHGAAETAERDDELVQLLTPEGERVARPDYDEYVADLTPESFRDLYRDMVLTRRFDGEATQLQRQGELGLWASLLGQEAAQIGSGRALNDDDYVFPTYREHGVAWCRGVDPVNLLGMFRGVNNGGWDPNSNNFHLYTIVIGSQTLHATGYAMGVAKDGAGSAVIAYFGDGASSQGDVAEAFTFSAVYNAPVVFFCQNNQWAISEPTERQTRVPLYQRARGYGFPGVRVDGNDVLACLAVTRAALEHSRGGAGPMLVEAFTYRMGAHTTSDDPSKYRSDEEREAWTAKDPILRLRRYLEREGYADDAFFAQLEEESEALGRRVREAVRSMPDPDVMAIFDNAYADGSSLVDEERRAFAAYQASFDEGPDGSAAAGAGAEGGK